MHPSHFTVFIAYMCFTSLHFIEAQENLLIHSLYMLLINKLTNLVKR